MNINYVENKTGKLFSFSRHDFKSNTDEDKNYIMIDGGFDYTRYTGNLKTDSIQKLIGDIREQFIWHQNYDKNNNRLSETNKVLLKDLDFSHICEILVYFTKQLRENEESIITPSWKAIHLIFIYELQYRYNNKCTI